MPSLTSAAAWPLQLPFVLMVVAGLLYAQGGRRHGPGHRGAGERRWRSLSFSGGLAVLFLALDTPLDPLADTSFAAHMAQHVLLLMVAPPLIVLSAPWLRIWQPLPLGVRRTVAKGVARGGWARPVRTAARLLAPPLPAWLVFNVGLVAWHVPLLYDATLHHEVVHDLEHLVFFGGGILFWLQAIDSPPVRRRLDELQRAVYVTAALAVSWVLAIVLGFASSPLYGAYAALAHRPGGLSALADQQLAAGIMWVPGSIPFTIAIVLSLYRWLAPEPETAVRGRERLGIAGGH